MRSLDIKLSVSALCWLAACDPSGSSPEGEEGFRKGYSAAESVHRTYSAFFARRTRCPSYSCGLNSPFIGHEMSTEGVKNSDGVRMVGAHHLDHGEVGLEVRGDELVGLAGGIELRGTDLVGLAIELEGDVDGAPVPMTAKLVEFTPTDMWAVGPAWDGGPFLGAPSYKFVYSSPEIEDQLLCPSTTEGAAEDGEEILRAEHQAELFNEGNLAALNVFNEAHPSVGWPHHAVVFAGERFDYETADVYDTEATGWFNWGCAGSSSAKLHLSAHTASGSARIGRAAPGKELTQAMLYAFTATYCPGAPRLTEPGHPIQIAEERGVVPRGHTASFLPTDAGTVEAMWDSNGAKCLSGPRLADTVPETWELINEHCGWIPECDDRGSIMADDLAGVLLDPHTPIITFSSAP